MNYSEEKLAQAIQTMRDACNEAEKTLKDPTRSLINKAAMILHSFSWGFANSSVGIESALSQIDRKLMDI